MMSDMHQSWQVGVFKVYTKAGLIEFMPNGNVCIILTLEYGSAEAMMVSTMMETTINSVPRSK